MLLYPGRLCRTRLRSGPGASLWFLQPQSHQYVLLLTLNLNMWVKITAQQQSQLISDSISRYFSQHWMWTDTLRNLQAFTLKRKFMQRFNRRTRRTQFHRSQYSACTVSWSWILVRNTLINISHNFTMSWSYRTRTIHQPIRSCVCVTRLFLGRTATAFVCCRRPAGSPL